MADPIRGTYDALKSKGYKNLGTFEEYSQKVRIPEKAEAIRKVLLAEKYKNIPDSATFAQKMGVISTIPSTPSVPEGWTPIVPSAERIAWNKSLAPRSSTEVARKPFTQQIQRQAVARPPAILSGLEVIAPSLQEQRVSPQVAQQIAKAQGPGASIFEQGPLGMTKEEVETQLYPGGVQFPSKEGVEEYGRAQHELTSAIAKGLTRTFVPGAASLESVLETTRRAQDEWKKGHYANAGLNIANALMNLGISFGPGAPVMQNIAAGATWAAPTAGQVAAKVFGEEARPTGEEVGALIPAVTGLGVLPIATGATVSGVLKLAVDKLSAGKASPELQELVSNLGFFGGTVLGQKILNMRGRPRIARAQPVRPRAEIAPQQRFLPPGQYAMPAEMPKITEMRTETGSVFKAQYSDGRTVTNPQTGLPFFPSTGEVVSAIQRDIQRAQVPTRAQAVRPPPAAALQPGPSAAAPAPSSKWVQEVTLTSGEKGYIPLNKQGKPFFDKRIRAKGKQVPLIFENWIDAARAAKIPESQIKHQQLAQQALELREEPVAGPPAVMPSEPPTAAPVTPTGVVPLSGPPVIPGELLAEPKILNKKSGLRSDDPLFIPNMPDAIAETVKQGASDMMAEVKSAVVQKGGLVKGTAISPTTGMPSLTGDVARWGTISTLPKWFQELHRTREDVLKNLQRIIDNDPTNKLAVDLIDMITDMKAGVPRGQDIQVWYDPKFENLWELYRTGEIGGKRPPPSEVPQQFPLREVPPPQAEIVNPEETTPVGVLHPELVSPDLTSPEWLGTPAGEPVKSPEITGEQLFEQRRGKLEYEPDPFTNRVGDKLVGSNGNMYTITNIKTGKVPAENVYTVEDQYGRATMPDDNALTRYFSRIEPKQRPGEPVKFVPTPAGEQGVMFQTQAKQPEGGITSKVPTEQQIAGAPLFEGEKAKEPGLFEKPADVPAPKMVGVRGVPNQRYELVGIEKGIATLKRKSGQTFKLPEEKIKSQAPPEILLPKSYRERRIAELGEQEKDVTNKLQDHMKSHMFGGPDLTFFDLASQLGVIKLKKGMLKFEDWAEDMAKDLGDKVRPYLRNVWARAQQEYSKEKLKGELSDELADQMIGRGKELLKDTKTQKYAQWAGQMKKEFGPKVQPHLSDLFRDTNDALRQKGLSSIQKITQALKESKPLRRKQEALYSAERSQRMAKALGVGEETRGERGYYTELGQLKGEMPKVRQFEELRSKIGQEDIDNLFEQIKNSKVLEFWDSVTARGGLVKLLYGRVPTQGELALLSKVLPREFIDEVLKKRSLLEKFKGAGYELANIPRAVMASFDLSAPFRQGLFLISHPKRFFGAFPPMFRAFGSEKAFKAIDEEIARKLTFDLMRDNKLALTEMDAILTAREERFMSSWAEKIPVAGAIIRASGRAYTGFLNKLRADVFEDLVVKADKLGLAPRSNPGLTKEIANFVNIASGRGSLGRLQPAAVGLNSFFFSPRLMASRLTLLNPLYYVKADPFVRREALKSLFVLAGTTATILGLSKMAGAEVSVDPRSADFAKIKVGNTRIDLLGGFQQYIRTAAQFITGTYISTTTGKEITLGEGYKPMTRLDILLRAVESKEAPIFSFVTDLLKGQDYAGKTLDIPQEIGARFVPMAIGDIVDIYKDDPNILPVGALGIFGVGLQTYQPSARKQKQLKTEKMETHLKAVGGR